VIGTDGFFNERSIHDVGVGDLMKDLRGLSREEQKALLSHRAAACIEGINEEWKSQLSQSPGEKYLDDISLGFIYMSSHRTTGREDRAADSDNDSADDGFENYEEGGRRVVGD